MSGVRNLIMPDGLIAFSPRHYDTIKKHRLPLINKTPTLAK